MAISHLSRLSPPVRPLISLCLRSLMLSEAEHMSESLPCPSVLLPVYLPAGVTKYNWMTKGRSEMHSTLNNQGLSHTSICRNTLMYSFLNLQVFSAIGDTNLLKIWQLWNSCQKTAHTHKICWLFQGDYRFQASSVPWTLWYRMGNHSGLNYSLYIDINYSLHTDIKYCVYICIKCSLYIYITYNLHICISTWSTVHISIIYIMSRVRVQSVID